jgi:hypothetical protein
MVPRPESNSATFTPSHVPVGDPQGRDATVVDHVQIGYSCSARIPAMYACSQFTLLGFVRGSTTLTQMCELLPRLFDCQDAPDGAAVTLPFLWIVMCRSRMRIVALKPMALDPSL